jgi:hypothetical protein
MPLRVVTKLCFRKPFHRLNISMRINSAAPSGNALPLRIASQFRHTLLCRRHSMLVFAIASQCKALHMLTNASPVRRFSLPLRCVTLP